MTDGCDSSINSCDSSDYACDSSDGAGDSSDGASDSSDRVGDSSVYLVSTPNPKDFGVCERTLAQLIPGVKVRLCPVESIAKGELDDGLTGASFLNIEAVTESDGIRVNARLVQSDGNIRAEKDYDASITDSRYRRQDWVRRRNERMRRTIMRLVIPESGARERIFWGILFGVRPTKLVHRYIDMGFSAFEIREILIDNYMLVEQKADLLISIAQLQRGFLPGSSGPSARVSLYIGIPFCPTRCYYCSFAAYPLGTHSHHVKGFLSALEKEIDEVSAFCSAQRLKIQTVYIGGGTPSSIGAECVERLLAHVNRSFFPDDCGVEEYTFEAGRPDTISEHLLDVLTKNGVDRVSINPQTMNDSTLRNIGRAHTTDDIRLAMELAASYEFRSINMDIILGLPGEDLDSVRHTLNEIGRMQPTNLTVHTLAMKHAAKWRLNADFYRFPPDSDVVSMLKMAEQTAHSLGMHPYYLYRQRYIAADLENVGYCVPGLESIYNIQMMEERQTVIAMGGGGVTKLIESGEWAVSRHINPKCPATYAQNIETIVEQKLAVLRAHFSAPNSNSTAMK